jgi:uncharacterized membrane protein YhfC
MVAVKNIDISAVVPHDQLTNTIESIAAYWATPWYDSLLGAIERVLTIPIQIALSVIMVQVFIRKKSRWFWIAILFHSVVNATAVIFMTFTNVYITELSVAFFTGISLWIIFFLKSQEPVKEKLGGNRILVESFSDNMSKIKEIDESLGNLDATKFQ